MANPMSDDLERAAQVCESSAALYLAYSRQGGRAHAEREAFARDWQTCTDMARRIRALRGNTTAQDFVPQSVQP